MATTAKFLEMLVAGASREDLDRVIAEAQVTGSTPEHLEALREQHALALRIHELMARQRNREAELTALYETARDLTAIRDLDAILAAIVRRARQLLGADMTYLSLNDEAEGASYMKVTDGALTPEFRQLRLPLGTGLLGLVAQSGAPYNTPDYLSDERFVHRDYIDTAVAGEQIRAILGVPLTVEGKVIGALLAVHRTVRPFPAGEVALLTSFAAHAAVALENARLFEQARTAVAEAAEANAALRARNEATERAARAHDRLTDVLLHGGGVVEVAEVLAEVLDGPLAVYDDEGRRLAGEDQPAPEEAVDRARTSGRCVQAGDCWVAVAAAGEEHLGTLVLRTDVPMDLAERRTLERGALVTALVLLFGRTEAEAESRVRGELLADLVSGRDLDATRLRERARQQGADLDAELAIAVAEHDSELPGARIAAALARELHGLGGVHDGQVVVLAPEEPKRLGEQLRARLDGATVGVTTATGGAEQVQPAWREARQALAALLRLGRTGEVSDPAGLGLARLLLGSNGPHELEEFVSATLGPVLDYDAERDTRLVDTLEAWFATGGGLRETADRLHIHPNTVSQRLERVGQLLGQGWREPSRKLDVQLALQMVRLRAQV
jgi:GAF domain-containing protein/PucR-like helix-turn-helix protein/diguanylate cyclase with GGDEF domain